MKFKKTLNREVELFTALMGGLGTGKTYALAYFTLAALIAHEPVFINMAIDLTEWPDLEKMPLFDSVELYAAWRAAFPAVPRTAVVRWTELKELLHPEVRCGTICFDELGTLENCPYPLVLKLINLRKDHLTVYATVQDNKLAASDLRRFFNRCLVMEEQHPWFTAWAFPDRVRPALECKREGCTKNCGHMTKGDSRGFPWPTTRYRARDASPKYVENKNKIESRGDVFLPFNMRVASVYQRAAAAGRQAMDAYKTVTAKRYNPKKYPMAARPDAPKPEQMPF